MEPFSLLSAFELPWGEARHPLAYEHAQASEERALNYGLIKGDEDDRVAQRFRSFVHLDGYAYPYTSFGLLSVVGGVNQWLYFMDDQFDEYPETHGNLVAVGDTMQREYDVLCERFFPDDPTPFDNFTRDLVMDLNALAPPGMMERFRSNVSNYLFEGSLGALRCWSRGETLGIDDYIELRALDSGVYPVIDCVEIAARVRLPEEVLENPLIRQMVDHAVRHLALTNDLFSYEKEVLQKGSTINVAHVIQVHDGCSLESATLRAVQLVNGFAKAFVEAERRLPRFEPALQGAVKAYLHGMKTWMRGNVDFSLRSYRFRSSTSPFVELNESGTSGTRLRAAKPYIPDVQSGEASEVEFPVARQGKGTKVL